MLFKMKIIKTFTREKVFVYLLEDDNGYEVEIITQIVGSGRKQRLIQSIITAWGESYQTTLPLPPSISHMYYSMRNFLIEHEFDIEWLDEDYLKYMDMQDAGLDSALSVII